MDHVTAWCGSRAAVRKSNPQKMTIARQRVLSGSEGRGLESHLGLRLFLLILPLFPL